MKLFPLRLAFAMTVLLILSMQPAFAVSNNAVEAYGIDTISGASTILKTKPTFANQSVTFLIEKPNNGELFLDAETNNDGIATLNLLDYHTRKAGVYTVSAKLANDDDFGRTSSFRVYPDEVSESQSQIFANTNTITANGVETATLTVSLSDRYGNPLGNHTVSLISSRETDSIIPIAQNAFTDSDGKIRFAVSSDKPGVSIYSAFDTTAGKSLDSRVKIAYFTTNAEKTPNFFGGDSQGSSEKRNFGNENAKIRAKTLNDDEGVSDDDTARRSEAFVAESLHLQSKERFSEGPQYVLAQAVATSGSVQGASLKLESIPDIVSPGSTVSFTVSAYDENNLLSSSYRGTVRFSSSDANATLPQDYTFTASDLGQHTFSLGLKFLTEGVQTLEVVDTSSISLKATAQINVTDEIQVPGDDKTLVILLPTEGTYSQSTIDVEGEGPAGWVIQIYDTLNKVGETIADSNGKFYFTLKNLESGSHDIYAAISDAKNATLETSKTVAITIDDSAPGIDEISIVPEGSQIPGAPFEIRVYAESKLSSVAVVLDTELTELVEDISQKGLYVSQLFAPKEVGEYPVDIILTDELGNSSQVEAAMSILVAGTPPPPVTRVSADSAPEQVILSWEAPAENIDHYRIFYGIDQYQLDLTVDVLGSFTSFPVTGLTAGVTYYFAMTAVDDLGLESEEQSTLVSAVPLGVVYPDPVTGVSARSEYGKVTLSWVAASDDTYIDHYRMYYGTVAENLSQTADTFNSATSWYIPELTPGVTYYFAVTAVDSDGYESQTKSSVISAAPLSAPLPGQTPETGPASDILIILSLLGAEGYVLRRYFGFRREYMRSKVHLGKTKDFYVLSS